MEAAITILSPETTIFVDLELLSNYQEEEFTLVHCNYWSSHDYQDGGWMAIWETTYLVNRTSQEKLALLHAIGIPIAPQKHYFKKKGEFFPFTLVFDKIPSSWQKFDLREDAGRGASFSFSNIERNNSGIYRVKVV